MSVRLAALNKGEYFEYNKHIYKKIDNREKSGRAENVETGEIVKFPTMLYVDKTELKKKTKKKIELPAPSGTEDYEQKPL